MPKITDVSPQQKSKLYSVFAEGEFIFSADTDFLIRHGIKIGNEYSFIELENLKDEAEARKAYRHSLYLLDRRDFSRLEMINRLKEKGYAEEHAEKAADNLVSAGFINDEKYAARLIEKFSSRYGKNRIFYELLKAGIQREKAKNMIAEQLSCEDEDKMPSIIKKELLRKYKGEKITDKKEILKVINKYRGRGFDYEIIKKAIENYHEYQDESIEE